MFVACLPLLFGFTNSDTRPRNPEAVGSTYLSSLCNFGQDIRIGMIELYGDGQQAPNEGSRFLSEHTAFSKIGNVTYMVPTMASCSVNDDCLDACGPVDTNDYAGGSEACNCVNSECVSPHQTSVVAATGGFHTCELGDVDPIDPDNRSDYFQFAQVDISAPCEEFEFGASRADYFFANNRRTTSTVIGGGGPLATVERRIEAYEWLMPANPTAADPVKVDIINESLGVDIGAPPGAYSRPLSVMAPVSDFYARKYGMPIVQASGGGTVDDGVKCDGFNTICVGGSQFAAGTGLFSPADFSHDPNSQTLDPSIETSNTRRLRLSKPDGVSWSNPFGPAFYPMYQSSVAGYPRYGFPVKVDGWRRSFSGTSFAAPLVTGLLTQFMQGVGTWSSDQLRAELKVHAWYQDQWTNLNNDACGLGMGRPVYPRSRSVALGDLETCDLQSGIGPIILYNFIHQNPGLFTDFCQPNPAPAPPLPSPPFSGPAPTSVDRETGVIQGPDDPGFVDHPSDTAKLIRPTGSPRLVGPQGFTVRSALSYYACPRYTPRDLLEQEPSAFIEEGVGYSDLVDFDIAILVWNDGDIGPDGTIDYTVVAESGSPDEVNEVFQFSTSSTQYKYYQPGISAPKSFQVCGPVFNPNGQAGEPFTFVSAY